MLIDIHSTDGRLAVAPPQDSRLCSTLQAAFFAFPVVGFRTHNICLAVLQIPRWSSAAAKRKFARLLLHLLQNALDELVGLEGIRVWNWR